MTLISQQLLVFGGITKSASKSTFSKELYQIKFNFDRQKKEVTFQSSPTNPEIHKSVPQSDETEHDIITWYQISTGALYPQPRYGHQMIAIQPKAVVRFENALSGEKALKEMNREERRRLTKDCTIFVLYGGLNTM